ncbi:hypothetical protein ARAM_004001 [Aspergillus rambellii]|uniref:STEEP1 domain-containing protein n=1 Tax=Aspergillus rambellii TaxID=308745 RepID=A0A0F8UTC0_9EURO|nr:hypothetical protein ARAM_004001 [Aspergillus rambellii]
MSSSPTLPPEHHDPPSVSTSPPKDQEQEPQESSPPQQNKLAIRTHHCRFCNHLLLATTRRIAALPRRKPPARDSALVLPLFSTPVPASATASTTTTTTASRASASASASATAPEDNDNDNDNDNDKENENENKQPHYTILLSTTVVDRKPTLLRREDGFEKRCLLRCGRCRVVIGYFLDAVHFPATAETDADAGAGSGIGIGIAGGEKEEEEEDARGMKKERVVYLLPGALVETATMCDVEEEEKRRILDREWNGWFTE